MFMFHPEWLADNNQHNWSPYESKESFSDQSIKYSPLDAIAGGRGQLNGLLSREN